MASGWETWLKGGIRQAQLEVAVPAHMAPEALLSFFVARRGGNVFLRSPLNPLAVIRREFVLAAGDSGLTVFRLKRPAIFRATIDGVETRCPWSQSGLQWDGHSFDVAGVRYFPIWNHQGDARRVAAMVTRN